MSLVGHVRENSNLMRGNKKYKISKENIES